MIGRVYVSHGITGLSEERICLLEQWATDWVTDVLEATPFLPRTVIVPEHEGVPCPPSQSQEGAPHLWSCYMRADIIEMLKCDAILMMPDWTRSKGASLELYIATQVGMPVFFYAETQEWQKMNLEIWTGLIE